MASTDLEQLKILLSVRDREFAKALNKNTDRVNRFSKQSSKGLSKTTTSFNALSRAASALLPAIGAAAITSAVRTVVAQLDNIGKTADKLGLTTDALQELRAVAESSGVSVTTLDMAMQRFGRRVAEARQGTGEAKNALAEMNIELFDSTGKAKDIEEVLNDVADAFTDVADQTDMNRLAMKLFDSEGVAMVNMLRNGSVEMNRMREEARKLGIVIDESLIRKAEEAQTALDLLSRVIRANLAVSLMDLAPVLVGATKLLADFTTAARNAVNSISDIPVNLALVTAAGDVEKTKEQIEKLTTALNNMPESQIGLGRDTATANLEKLNQLLAVQEERLLSVAAARREQQNPTGGGGDDAETTDRLLGFKLELEATNELIAAQKEKLRLSGMSSEAAEREIVATQAAAMAERLRSQVIASGNELDAETIAQINELVGIYQDQGNALVDATAAQTASNGARSDSIDLMDEEAAALEKLEAANARNVDELARIIETAESVEDALDGMLRMILKIVATNFIEGLFGIAPTSDSGSAGKFFNNIGSGLVGKASGGAAIAGQAYEVGEHGREPFVPAQNGRILSVAQAKSAVGNGGAASSFVQTNNIYAMSDGDIDRVLAKRMPQLKNMMLGAIREEKQRGAL